MNIHRYLIAPLLLLAAIDSIPASAQNEDAYVKRHQLSLGLGGITAQETESFLGNAVDLPGYDVYEVNGKGAFIISYYYFPSGRVGVGVTGVYEAVDIFYNPPEISSYNTFALLVNGRFNYITKPRFDLYSKAGAGIAFFNLGTGIYRENARKFAFQATALGARFGRTVNAFLELGFGYEGLIHGGVCFKF